MSVRLQLDDLLQKLSEDTDALDKSTKNIANATSRVTYELSKTHSLTEKYKLPLDKYEKVIDFTQVVIDTCSNFIPIDETNQNQQIEGNAVGNNNKVSFEQFASQVESELNKCEKEIVKLNSLDDIVRQCCDK